MAQKSNMWLRTMLFGGLVCTGIFLFSGNGLRDVILGKRAYDQSSFFFYLEITNRTFDNDLLDPSSDYYKSLASEVEDLMTTAFNCSSCPTSQGYGGTYDITFSNGSLVLVKMTLDFYNIEINRFVVKYFFLQELEKNPPKYLNLNLHYTEKLQTPVVATSTTEDTPTSPMTIQTTTPMPTKTTSPMVTKTTSPMATQTSSPVSSLPSPVTHKVNNSTSVSHSSRPPVTESTNGTSGSSIRPTRPTGLPPTTGSSMSTSPQVMTPDHGNTTTTSTTTANGHDSRQRPYWLDWVPGWAIALLVLASVTLLLLILLLIALLSRWCCKREKKPLPVSDPYPPPFNPSSAPSYTSHSPASAPKVLSNDHPEAKRNRTGLYVVNP